MSIQLKMNTNVRRGVRLVLDGEVDPIIDLDNVRYLLDVEQFIEYGALIWTRFDLQSQAPLDTFSFTRRYASHNMFHELLLGTNWKPIQLQTTTFPAFSIPDDLGTVIP